MKAVNKINILFLLFVIAGLFSCSRHWEETQGTVMGEDGIPVAITLKTTAAAPDLQYWLYVFIKSAPGTPYRYKQAVALTPETGNTYVKFLNSDLSQNSYRFLFLATPKERPEVAFTDTSLSGLPGETAWEEVRLTTKVDSLTIHNYYGINEMTGQQLLDATLIQGTLTRMVGQMQFWFYKTGDGEINTPVDIDTEQYGSVLDRIHTIDIVYSQMTTVASFNENNELQPAAYSDATYTQHIRPVLTPDLKLPFPQSDPSLQSPGSPRGSALIQGIGFLPSDAHMKVCINCKYYDTTPVCGNTGSSSSHVHNSSCYSQGTLTLFLPPRDSTPGLDILPDHYTLNKAGLPCNRAIDIKHESQINIHTEWKN